MVIKVCSKYNQYEVEMLIGRLAFIITCTIWSTLIGSVFELILEAFIFGLIVSVIALGICCSASDRE